MNSLDDGDRNFERDHRESCTQNVQFLIPDPYNSWNINDSRPYLFHLIHMPAQHNTCNGPDNKKSLYEWLIASMCTIVPQTAARFLRLIPLFSTIYEWCILKTLF